MEEEVAALSPHEDVMLIQQDEGCWQRWFGSRRLLGAPRVTSRPDLPRDRNMIAIQRVYWRFITY